MATTHPPAINPLPWILNDLGYRLDREVLTRAMAELHDVGYRHLTVEKPLEMSTADYRALLSDNGFAPAPGYFSGNFSDADQHGALVESIKKHAALHAELGLDRAFIAEDIVPARLAVPAKGVGFDPERIAVIAEGMRLAADAAAIEGVRYGLHPHVATGVETEAEAREVLDRTAGSSLGFGPDTGHIAWAGGDPAALIADYSTRVLSVHVKDVDNEAILAAARHGDDYLAATNARKVWREPGRGDVDWEGVLRALAPDFSGWFVVEVDVPFASTPAESAAQSLEFIRRVVSFEEVST
ncbi:sugar phosphate isomerase/epimerase family protein [Microbacterium saperdae]|uniref:2-keto-myo-inositol dehydratase n=1 Tax=Microbacterium saperdae TaxID=69368 RepID=A0A543BL87_9MICO|nr:sugar phosphate isomerase/epimerase [Microbacterium saperdae]TQL85553.1 2-keto-myo-inositol dehydratase [Microbacterium saperdae]GGM62852.1 inosose dehydratase [Microbacterium saperdae]